MEAPPTPLVSRGLASLANEILDNIFSHLDTLDLHALSLTCRATTAAANNASYKSFTNYRKGSANIAAVDRPLHLFLRTLCERPDLAVKVKKMVVLGWESEYEVAKNLDEDMGEQRSKPADGAIKAERACDGAISDANDLQTSATFQLFINAAMDSQLIRRENWTSYFSPRQMTSRLSEMKLDEDLVRNLRNKVEDAYLVIVLALLPNLEHLEVRRLSAYSIMSWHQFLSRSPTALRSLKHLNMIGVKGVQTNMQVLDILPHLSTLEMASIDVRDHHFRRKRLPTTQLAILILSNCVFSRVFLEKMVEQQRLETFTLIGPYHTGHILERILQRLVLSNASLRHLTYNSNRYSRFSLQKDLSFLQFTNLDSLEISQRSLLGPLRDDGDITRIEYMLRRRIPPTASSLSIRRLSDAAIRVLEHLALLRKSNLLPKLSVVLMHFVKTTELSEEVQAGLKGTFRDARIVSRIQFTD
ncbi:hypothetical protein K505DRAFT_372026 [Melanomma pulvis-pyrius CBS 109.77]|uniref:F-box domain-containing protein n=1 Tax=Melanomma pulvis-pyrius CBS 109.77 TaxID=1314802 RepID=A0A6A6XQ55_9PLEO|nr:hypothetical protein K505DRAFT_372026 [Melanomma pulvis-pyrius CBS 109.77]